MLWLWVSEPFRLAPRSKTSRGHFLPPVVYAWRTCSLLRQRLVSISCLLFGFLKPNLRVLHGSSPSGCLFSGRAALASLGTKAHASDIKVRLQRPFRNPGPFLLSLVARQPAAIFVAPLAGGPSHGGFRRLVEHGSALLRPITIRGLVLAGRGNRVHP